MHCNYFELNGRNMLQLDVNTFCRDICSAVEKWINDTKDNKQVNEYINGMLKIHPSGDTVFGIKFGK